jgi:hypothetical protein
MPLPVGIGNITYNRKDMLSETIDRSGAVPHAPSNGADE